MAQISTNAVAIDSVVGQAVHEWTHTAHSSNSSNSSNSSKVDRNTAECPRTPITVDIIQVQFVYRNAQHSVMPIVTNSTERLFSASIHASEPFTLDMSLGFTSLAVNHTPSIVYRVQCQAQQIETGQTIHLGDRVANVPYSPRSSYSVVLPDLVLSAAGAYRLNVLATLQNLPAAPAAAGFVLLQVV